MSLVPLSPIAAALAHVEPLLEKSRVLLIGSALTRVPEMILARGARLCHVADPDPRRVAQAASQNTERRITYSHWSEALVRDGAYDIAVVANLEEHDRPQEILEGARRAIAADGLAIVSSAASQSPSGLLSRPERSLSYADLERFTRGAFPSVTFLAQTPFVGFAVVSLSLSTAPIPSLDNALLNGESDEVDYYVALCGAEGTLASLDLDDMTVVQMPGQLALEVGRQSEVTRGARIERRLESLEEELRLAQRRERELEEELARVESAPRNETEIEGLRAALQKTTADLESAQRGLTEALASPKGAEASSSLEELTDRATTAERELERTKKERKWADDRVRRLERELEEAILAQEELDKVRARIQTLETHLKESEDEVDELTEKVNELERTIQLKENELSQRSEPTAAFEKENLALEAQLKERGAHILALDKQLADLSLYAQTLIAEKSRPEAAIRAPADSELQALSGELADKEAELLTARWTIDSLKERLAQKS